MVNIIATNIYNQSITLTNNNLFKLINIEGLAPVKSDIKTITTENIAGEIYATSKDEKRTITFQFEFDESAKQGLNSLCSIFRKNQIVTLTFDEYYINCYVDDINFDMYSEKVPCQIVTQCLYPYFKSNNRFKFNFVTNIINKLEFPTCFYPSGQEFGEIREYQTYFINNQSNIDCGCLIELNVLSEFNGLTITNLTNGSILNINVPDTLTEGFYMYLDLESDIKTFRGINESGVAINLLKYINLNTNLFYLSPNENEIEISTQSVDEKSYIEMSFNYLKDWVM